MHCYRTGQETILEQPNVVQLSALAVVIISEAKAG